MNQEIGSNEAKATLPDLLRRVEAGECFTITHRGKAIALLTPTHAVRQLKTEAAIDRILNSRKHTLSDQQLDELKNQSRR